MRCLQGIAYVINTQHFVSQASYKCGTICLLRLDYLCDRIERYEVHINRRSGNPVNQHIQNDANYSCSIRVHHSRPATLHRLHHLQTRASRWRNKSRRL